jgi:uncharacterized protein
MPQTLEKYHVGYIWKGMGYPPIDDRDIITVQEDLALVKSSIYQILNTTPGERVMYPEFGSNLRRLLFEPNDIFLEADVRYSVSEAIARWEPRVQLLSAQIISDANDRNLGIIKISVEFRLVNNPKSNHFLLVPIFI